jgi:hypothetical protein
MDKNYFLFLNLLSISVRNNGIDDLDAKELNSIDWDAVFQLAGKHQVQTLLFPVIKKIQAKGSYIPEDIYARWTSFVLFLVSTELVKIDGFKETLSEFNRQNVPVIIFKGIEIKDIYPFPELRIMGDIDILVQKEHFAQGDTILQKLGYVESHRDHHVIEYMHPYLKEIELHNTIIDVEKDAQFQFFNEIIWTNVRKSVWMGENALTIKPSVNLAYLLIHMYKHFARNGVGVRQLIDVALYGVTYKNDIEWNEFWELVSKAGIIDYTFYVFACSKRYLNLDISQYNEELDLEDIVIEEYLELFTTELIDGGVFGGDNARKKSENYMLNDGSNKKFKADNMQLLIFFKLFFNLLFPKPKRLSARYDYAIKQPWLLPAAWIHRIFHVLTKRRKYAVTYNKSLFSLARSKDRLDYLRSIGLLN